MLIRMESDLIKDFPQDAFDLLKGWCSKVIADAEERQFVSRAIELTNRMRLVEEEVQRRRIESARERLREEHPTAHRQTA